MTNQQLTINLKAISSALGCLDRRSVSEIITLGGVECSKAGLMPLSAVPVL
jgi:hypothetical protein